MNIVLNHYEKGNLSIPSVILKLAGLHDENLLQGYIERGDELHNGALAVCKKKMTAMQLITAIKFFKELASEFTIKLAIACGECDDCGYCCEEDTTPQECKDCKTPCHGIEIPSCVLEDAGIDVKAGLEFEAGDGEVIIREIADDCKPISDELIDVLTRSNICIKRLHDLIESGEVVYE